MRSAFAVLRLTTTSNLVARAGRAHCYVVGCLRARDDRPCRIRIPPRPREKVYAVNVKPPMGSRRDRGDRDDRGGRSNTIAYSIDTGRGAPCPAYAVGILGEDLGRSAASAGEHSLSSVKESS